MTAKGLGRLAGWPALVTAAAVVRLIVHGADESGWIFVVVLLAGVAGLISWSALTCGTFVDVQGLTTYGLFRKGAMDWVDVQTIEVERNPKSNGRA